MNKIPATFVGLRNETRKLVIDGKPSEMTQNTLSVILEGADGQPTVASFQMVRGYDHAAYLKQPLTPMTPCYIVIAPANGKYGTSWETIQVIPAEPARSPKGV